MEKKVSTSPSLSFDISSRTFEDPQNIIMWISPVAEDSGRYLLYDRPVLNMQIGKEVEN